ncbi:MAG: TlpA family protein disulfide reductase, partial [Algibacter sp.]
MNKLLCIAFAIAVFSCKNDVTADYAIISGKITNKQAGDVTMNSEDRTFKEILDIAEDGSFTDTLSTDIKSYVLYDGTNPVFLKVEPGFNLNIAYDALDFENTIVISGIGSEINNYLVVKRKGEMELNNKSAEVFVQDEEQYKASMMDFKNGQLELLNNSLGLPDDFISNEKRNINYGYLGKLNTYERAHKYFTKNEDFKVSDDFLNEVADVDYNNIEDFEFSSDYKGIV